MVAKPLDIECVYAPADREVAQALASMLEATTLAKVDLERGLLGAGESFLRKMDVSWYSDFTIVLLSPQSVPNPWNGDEWQRCLWTAPAESGVAVHCLQTGPCHIPELLRRGKRQCRFLDAQPGPHVAMAELRRRLIELRRSPQPRRFVPTGGRLAIEPGQTRSIEQVIVDQPGMLCISASGPYGKTTLAYEIARRYYLEFEEVFWIACAGRTLAEVTGELVSLDSPDRMLESRRCLLVLDGVDCEDALPRLPQGRTSYLITTRLCLPIKQTLRLELSKAADGSPLSCEHAAILSVCRLDFLLPEMLTALDVPVEVLTPLDRDRGVCRAPGYLRDYLLPPEERHDNELRHANAVLCAARANPDPRLLPDLLLAARRFTKPGPSGLLARLTRCAERIARDHCRVAERAALLEGVLAEAWRRQDHNLISAFALDLAGLYEDADLIAEADLWRSRGRQSTPGQLAFDF